MTKLKTLHVGGIIVDRETVFISHKATRHDIFCDLNNWLFDFCYANKKTIYQLPPLDDFIRSKENANYWYINVPEVNCLVWLESELIDFG